MILRNGNTFLTSGVVGKPGSVARFEPKVQLAATHFLYESKLTLAMDHENVLVCLA